jgi:hypothetical protein
MRAAAGSAALFVSLAGATLAGGDDAADTCVGCHAEEEDSDLSDPVNEWRRSVHAAAQVTCDGCHGGDPFEEDGDLSMDEDEAGFVGAPGWTEVSEFCGTCHEDVLDGYSQSVMAGEIAKGNQVAVCTTCHMSDGHAIVRAVPEEILTAERCGECHDAERAFKLLALLVESRDHLARVSASLERIHGTIDTSRINREMAEVRQRAVVAAHTYDHERITEVASVARERLDAAEIEIEQLAREAGFRRRVGTGASAFFAVTCFGAMRLERNLRRRSRQGVIG